MDIRPLNRFVSGPVRPRLININPQKIGIILKDGSIQFKNQDAAIEYGINRCCAALQGNNPFERGININGSRVIREIQGNETKIKIHNNLDNTEVFIHGHPDFLEKGITNALSDSDYECFIKYDCMKKMYAVNSKGEFYKMEKIPGFNFSESFQKEICSRFGDFNTKLMKTIYGGPSAPQWQWEIVDECFRKKDPEYYRDVFCKRVMYPIEAMEQPPKYVIDGGHLFWVKFGELFGVKTETNFSNFKFSNWLESLKVHN